MVYYYYYDYILELSTHPEMGVDIDFKHFLDLFWGMFEEWFAWHNTSIVEEHVNVTNFFPDLQQRDITY